MNRSNIPTSYEACAEFLDGKEQRKVCNNTYVVRNSIPSTYYGVAGTIGIELHGSTVVMFRDDEAVCIDSCGYYTATTKDRINRCLDDRGFVFQSKGLWYFQSKNHSEPIIEFKNGMIIENTKESK